MGEVDVEDTVQEATLSLVLEYSSHGGYIV